MNKVLYIVLLAVLLSCSNPNSGESINIKAQSIHAKVLTIDSHTDTPMWLDRDNYDIGKDNTETARGSKVDLIRMKEGGLDACFFAVFVGQGKRTPEGNEKARSRAIKMFDDIHSSVASYPELAEVAYSTFDAYRIEKEGKRAIFIGLENGYPLGKDINLVKDYYDRGARYITLCHSKNNDICDSSSDKDGAEHDGLSEFGAEVVQEMNQQGIMIDVSHASDESFYDILEVTKTPIIASHSCARALCDNPRNLDDDMLKALAKNGGVIQMCILSAYVEEPLPNPERDSARAALRQKWNNWDDLDDEQLKLARKDWQEMNVKYPRKLSSVAKVVDHIDHIKAIAGIDHVGMGTDFDGGGGVDGCNDVSEMGNITEELVRRGYTEEEIEKIWGKNLMRVFSQVEGYALNKE